MRFAFWGERGSRTAIRRELASADARSKTDPWHPGHATMSLARFWPGRVCLTKFLSSAIAPQLSMLHEWETQRPTPANLEEWTMRIPERDGGSIKFMGARKA